MSGWETVGSWTQGRLNKALTGSGKLNQATVNKEVGNALSNCKMIMERKGQERKLSTKSSRHSQWLAQCSTQTLELVIRILCSLMISQKMIQTSKRECYVSLVLEVCSLVKTQLETKKESSFPLLIGILHLELLCLEILNKAVSPLLCRHQGLTAIRCSKQLQLRQQITYLAALWLMWGKIIVGTDNVVSKCLTREKTVTGDRISFTRRYMDQIKYLLKLANPWHRLIYFSLPLTSILGVGKGSG